MKQTHDLELAKARAIRDQLIEEVTPGRKADDCWTSAYIPVSARKGKKCKGTGRQTACQTCALVPIPWGYWEREYIKCPICHQRQPQVDWPRGTTVACPVCEAEYVRP